MKHLKPPPGVEVHYRLNFTKSASLLAFAIGIDVLQFLLSLTGVGEIVSEILGFIVDIALPMTAYFMGVSYGGKKGMLKTAVVGVADIIELIPFLNDIPTYTIEVVLLIMLTYIEDVETAIEKAKKHRSQSKAQQRQIEWHQKYATRMRQDLQGIAVQQQAQAGAVASEETAASKAAQQEVTSPPEQTYGGTSSITQSGGRAAFSYGSSAQARPLDLRASNSGPGAQNPTGGGSRYAPANDNAPQVATANDNASRYAPANDNTPLNDTRSRADAPPQQGNSFVRNPAGGTPRTRGGMSYGRGGGRRAA